MTDATEKKKVPDHVDRFKDKPIEPIIKDIIEDKFTPETIEEDESLVEKLPNPTGYRILILPFTQKSVTKGGIHLADSYLEKERLGTNVGFVVSLGPDAYKDKNKFPNGAWCQERDWIIFCPEDRFQANLVLQARSLARVLRLATLTTMLYACTSFRKSLWRLGLTIS